MTGAATWAGKTLEEEIARLILLHGKSEFREAAVRLTKGTAGPRKIDDMPLFREIFDQDARDWLDRKDPHKRVSTLGFMQSIIQKLGADLTSFDRIYRKLLECRTRSFLGRAYLISESAYPVSLHLDTIRALIAETKWPIWNKIEASVMLDVETFRELYGDFTDETSLEEIRAANRQQAQNVGPLSKYGLIQPD
jgi:hypothetical protein